MANERYKLMIIARWVVHLGLKPLSIAFITPPSKGKTDTKRIFLYNHQDCNEITSMSDTALGEALIAKRYSPLLIVDDPLNWIKYDFESLIRYFKFLYEERITTPRRTKYNPHDVPTPARISTIIFLHSKQYVEVERTFALTGYDERVLLIWSDHDRQISKYISKHYRKYKIDTSRKTFPEYDLDGFSLLDKPRSITELEDVWISDIFGGTGQERTVRTICECVPELVFESLKDFLKSNNKRSMFIEDIKFKEPLIFKPGHSRDTIQVVCNE